MSNRWLTKQDILDDLEEATGKRVTNIDDRFAVRGPCPPPVNVPEDEDEDEILQRYGPFVSKNSTIEEPDLSGITHMLRMVNDYYDCAKCDDTENMKELEKAAATVITISKLDPNVPEFVPKSEIKRAAEIGDSNKPESSDCLGVRKSSPEILNINKLGCNDDDESNKTDASHKNETNNNDIDLSKKIDISNLNINDIKDLTEKLKQKIVGTSKNECLTKKRERNLAMASLLKLYTNIPKSPKQSQPIKLMTPNDFQTVPEEVSSLSFGSETNQTDIKQSIEDEIIEKTDPKEDELSEEASNYVKPVLTTTDSENQSSSSNSQESSDLSSTKPSNLHNGIFMSKEVAESVKKVDKWLNGPEKKKHKPRPVFFGPVTFKRKGTGSIKSSESQSLSVNDTQKDRPSSTNTCDSFVPSAYAEELAKSFMQRNQTRAIQNEDIWTKLERELKEKDKVIKERKLKQNQQ